MPGTNAAEKIPLPQLPTNPARLTRSTSRRRQTRRGDPRCAPSPRVLTPARRASGSGPPGPGSCSTSATTHVAPHPLGHQCRLRRPDPSHPLLRLIDTRRTPEQGAGTRSSNAPCSYPRSCPCTTPSPGPTTTANTAQGKKHNAALICLARRRVDVLHAMLRNGTPFTSNPSTLGPQPLDKPP